MQEASARTRQEYYLHFREGYPLLLSCCTDFTGLRVTLSHRTGSQRHAVRVVRVVIVAVAVAVHIAEIVRGVR